MGTFTNMGHALGSTKHNKIKMPKMILNMEGSSKYLNMEGILGYWGRMQEGVLWYSFLLKTSKIGQEMAELGPFFLQDVE